jgi:hypothetical protein
LALAKGIKEREMFAGIVTGVVSSAIFAFIILAMKQWLWPLYVASMYKGTKVNGEWDVFYSGAKDSKDSSAVITFKQVGIKITGKSVVSKNKAGETVNRKYKYAGTFLDKSIVLTFEDENNPQMMGGAMVFSHIDSDGKEMSGKSIYFKPEKNAVDVSDAILRKRAK